MKKIVALIMALIMTAGNVYGADVTDEDMELLRSAAGCYVSIYSIMVLADSFESTVSYYNKKMNGALMYSYSNKQIEDILDKAISECGEYKTAVSEMTTGSLDENMVDKCSTVIGAYISDFTIMKKYYCTDMRSNLSDDEVKSIFNASKNDIDSAKNAFIRAYKKAEAKTWEIAKSNKYNALDEEVLTESEKTVIDKYYSEIGACINEATNYMAYGYSEAEQSMRFEKAAKIIREKLNSTDTPEKCMFNREVMLLCCDLLEQAQEDVNLGAFRQSGYNRYYIEFEYSVVAPDMIFNVILDEKYDTKYSNDDESYEGTDVSQVI